jgi:hypothetical protein
MRESVNNMFLRRLVNPYLYTGSGNLPVVILLTVLFVFLNSTRYDVQGKSILVDAKVSMIDGATFPYSNIRGGDTIFLKAGIRDQLLIRNLYGSSGKPVIIINKGGLVLLSTNGHYGISIRNCRYFRLSGQGDQNTFYGIKITKVADGAGIGVVEMSSDYEIDHVYIENCPIAGIYAKTDPDCSLKNNRGNFTQYNTIIHDNYLENIGNEGLYIGSTKYNGQTVNCNGRDTTLYPSLLKGVRVYNNIVKYAGWDGIQVSSASEDCQVYGNTVLFDSQAEVKDQMSGVIIGGGSRCDCYNNIISGGKGDGIESHGLGGYRIFNNIIIDAGQTYYPGDKTKMKHGIFVSDVSALKDSSFYILFNDIINPKSDGIRFQSTKTNNNLIASNLIVNPGNYSYYENDNTSFTGNDSYVFIPSSSSDVDLHNNFLTRNIADAMISKTDYSVRPGSPLIDASYFNTMKIDFDFNNHHRPSGTINDIGALEFDPDDTDPGFTNQLLLFPNPVYSKLTMKITSGFAEKSVIDIHDMTGKIIDNQEYTAIRPGEQEVQIDTNNLPSGIYIISVRTGGEFRFGKFIKAR